MGTNFKRAVLEENTANVIKQWHDTVRQKRKKRKDYSESVYYSTTTWDSSSRTSPHALYSHPPSPTSFTATDQITGHVASETEISPHDHQQEIFVVNQDEHTPPHISVISSTPVVQIEMSNIPHPNIT